MSLQSNPVESRMARHTVNVDDLARMLGIGRSTVYKLVADDSINAIRLGRRIVIPTSEVDRLLSGTDSGPTKRQSGRTMR